MTVTSAIIGSAREGRFSEKPARWILRHLAKRDGVDARSDGVIECPRADDARSRGALWASAQLICHSGNGAG